MPHTVQTQERATDAHGIVIVRFRSSSAIGRLVRRRIAFIYYLPTHYKRALFDDSGRRMDADFYFYADERERYWNKALSLVGDGRFRRVELRRFRIAGEAFMPGIVRMISAERYDAVIKSLNGRVMLPLTY